MSKPGTMVVRIAAILPAAAAIGCVPRGARVQRYDSVIGIRPPYGLRSSAICGT